MGNNKPLNCSASERCGWWFRDAGGVWKQRLFFLFFGRESRGWRFWLKRSSPHRGYCRFSLCCKTFFISVSNPFQYSSPGDIICFVLGSKYPIAGAPFFILSAIV